MTATALAIIAVLLWVIFKVLNIHSTAVKPIVYCKDSSFLRLAIKFVPSLDQAYVPTRIWGFNGHIQTIVHSVIGRVKCPWPNGERSEVKLSDGSTLTYNVYQPLGHSKRDVTLLIVPGICNSSESVYVRTMVHYAQYNGYRCAVLNHIGTLSSVPLTAPRIFSYGYTGDLHSMVLHITNKYPESDFICIGYSMGGNIVTKYVGETDIHRPNNLIGAVSVCQGYDILTGTKYLLQWQNFRRVYLYAMTEAMKNMVLRHKNVLLSEQAKQDFQLVERDIAAAATLPELDDAYTRKIYKFSRLQEMYTRSSSLHYIKDIKIPIIFINSLDDPLVPEVLLEPIRQFAESRDGTVYVEVNHGGHLGFYEGGILYPNTLTWLDRTLIDTANFITSLKKT